MRSQIFSQTIVLLIFGFFTASCRAQEVVSITTTTAMWDPIVFPREHETFWRSLSCAIHLTGVSVLAYCLAKRTDKHTSKGLTSHPLTRWLVILIFIDSWLFIFTSGLLVAGVGLSLNEHTCTAGIFTCIVLYAASKLLIYWFLAEKVYFVHPRTSGSKLKSPAYRICIVFVLGYVVIIVLAVVGRIAFLRDGHQTVEEAMGPVGSGTDGQCVIGIGRPASMSLLVYDLILNVLFTCMFLYPVYRSSKLSPRLKSIAKKTLLAALVALLTSAINICILTVLHGRELGWICLASCGADIIVNSVAIYIATSFTDGHQDSDEKSLADTAFDGRSSHRFVDSIGKGIRKIVPSQRSILPIANVGIASSTGGILETSQGRQTDTNTRSVHFSPETTRQDRTLIGYELDLEAATGDVSASDVRPEPPNTRGTGLPTQPVNYASAMFQPRPRRSAVNSSTEIRQSLDLNNRQSSDQPAVREAESDESNEALIRQLPSAIYLHLIDVPPLGQPEDTTLEIRQEGRISRNPRKLPPCLVSMAIAHVRARSKSVDARTEEEPSRGRILLPAHLTDPPSSVHEARTRLKVLSALTDITRRKRDSQTNESLLEVSVRTQTDQRIEVRKKRNSVLDDYHGQQYARRGRSASSSGGL